MENNFDKNENEKKDYFELNWDSIQKNRETIGKKIQANKVVNGDIVTEDHES